ncbi:T9SS outer membrane translocon Sov/SprA [Parapedobacter lycopersici]|uniref:T9SS outer membrane translocon Sov/SprA n=1 Tax=Parapedobacter lycopersici TaxID=1864939 RepID=UPI00214D9424|nr:cell surface protein SprA [Parapedobacter lycopersici]
MKRKLPFRGLLLLLSLLAIAVHSSGQTVVDSTSRDSIKLKYPFDDLPFLNLYPKRGGFRLGNPSNIDREVVFDPITRQYIIREKLGSRLYRPPQYLTIDEYQEYEQRLLKQNYWRELSDRQLTTARQERLIPTIYVQSEAFERIFGGNTIDIIPRGSADISIMAQRNKNANPMFNERQRRQWGFDFDQRIQMNLTGQIGDRLKITTNYNTEAQFDFENQIRLDYTGKDDDIIQRIELGNVSMPLNTTLISGTQALFGLKTQLQFGRLNVTGIFSQQRSQQREITIKNGAQESEFALKADEYEDNQHYFLSQYFRDNFNRAMALAPLITTDINITQIEVWISNRSNSVNDSRDVLALMDLGEYTPYNSLISRGSSRYPSTGIPGELATQVSNNLLTLLPPDARYTQSNGVQAFFQGTGGNDNYAKLTYARKLNEGTEYTVNRRLGFISLNMPLNGDQILAVAYRYTANGREYQVGEFSTDIPVTPSQPQMLYAKLLKNEILKTNLPTWDLMMKNIYSIGAYGVGQLNFKFNIFRIEDESGVERPAMYEGQNTQNKLWIQLTGLDRLNPQNAQQPDGFFDFLPGLTIDPERGRVMFPVVEPFGSDLARQFVPGAEQALIDKYAYQALYDSTKVIAQQLFPNKNRYLIKGTYESEVGTEFQLGAINVPRGSVQVFAGPAPLQEGVDFMVDYDIGRVRILNQALLQSGQPIRIKMENNELFGLQQRTMLGGRLDYLVNDKLQLGGTIMNLTERPLTQKVNIGEEPISNTMWGLDMTYNSPSRWLTRLVDKIPFIDTREESSISFYGEFAQLLPGHPRALNFAGTRSGITYVDDFENSRSFIDLKGAYNWQLSGTPQLFPESQLIDSLPYGFNRARLAFYNIDPIFYRNINLTPSNINHTELSSHRVREVLEQEVFPYRESTTGLPLFLSTLDLAFYPTIRGPYNYTTTGVNPDGTLTNPRRRWGGMFRKIDAPDFEAQNIEFIELWMMDPFATNPGSPGGDLYFNLGNISEDILKDGRKAMENGMSPSGDLSQIDETNWGRVPRQQPVIQAFDNDPAARARQDIGLDGLNDSDERGFHASFLTQTQALLNSNAAQELMDDPSGDNFRYFRGPDLDNQNAGILKRYERFNGPEGNARTPEQSQNEFGVETSASTLLPDGEDINRDNNMNEAEEYYQYKVSLRPQDMVVGENYISDMHVAEVSLPNGTKEQVKWYQFRIPLAQYKERIGDIRDFKSIRFIRMFMTDFADTAVVRLAQVQLARGEWRRYNAENNTAKVIVDPSMGNVSLDQSTIEVAAVNIEQNGNRQPIPYVVPPGIERQMDWGNLNTNVRLNEQSLSLDVKNLRDGYGRAAYRTATNDFRAYGRLEMFIHAEGMYLKDGDFRAFIRVGTDDQYNYYQYDMPLKITQPGTADPETIWPQENRMNVRIRIFQEAKEARNKATLNGQPWPIDEPFTYFDGQNRVIVMGQPDISKVRFYMLGVMNPLRGSEVSIPGDDGLDKSGVFWFNELRLSDFDDKGGWAVTARMNAKLADFANITVSGSKSTIGFGSIDQRIGERSRSEDRYFDIVTNAELGKFFPTDYGLRIPLFFSYTNQVSTPEYNPLMPDIEMNSALANLSRNSRDSLLRVTQDYTTRKSFNLTNVRKIRTDIEKPVRPWDIENFSATYAYSQYYHRDYLTEIALQKNYRAALDYTFSASGEHFIEPLKNSFKKNYLSLLRDFNFNLMPSLLNFRIDVNRIYNENTLRDNSPDNFLPSMGTLYNKNFTMNRLYGISWNLTKSLRLDFNATNYAIVDEPDGRLYGLKRDTLWENFWRLGRTTDYNHMLNITYSLPISKIPGLDWINVDARYGAQFAWQTEPLLSINSAEINMGNSIQNSRTIQVNPTLNMAGLYNKFGFIRNNTGLDASGAGAFFTGLLTSIKNINAAYTRVQNTFLPGYLPKTNMLGYDFDRNAPGWGFLFGSQRDIRMRAAANGWITTDTLQTQLYMNSLTEDFSLRAMMEPFRDLNIELTAVKLNNRNYTSSFQYTGETDNYRNLTPVTTGNYSISYLSIGTAFKDHEQLFRTFERNRQAVSQRLGQRNPNSTGSEDGFADGYDRTSQDVVVNAFLAAYRGKDARRSKLTSFPNIPFPNWNVTYNGLSKIPLLSEFVTSLTLRHGYNSRYSINGYNSVIRYSEVNGFPFERDINGNFLPEYQFQQISIFEQFTPLLGLDARFKNDLTANVEYRRGRTLNLSLQNSQLALLNDESFVLGMGYRATGFRMPFGWFSNFKMSNDLNFRLDVSINDLKTLVYRSDINESEVSAGNKSISYRPSIDYVINQRFNIRLFFDSNSVRPYTSQTFATSYANFGFNLRVMFQ